MNQLGSDNQNIASVKDPSGQNGVDAQVPARLDRVHVYPFVTENSASRDDPQVPELGKVVDETLGDAIGKILCIRRTGRGNERQYGERFHFGAQTFAKTLARRTVSNQMA
ncbi:MAG TPA: hypothetical protein VKE70_16205 [Candidatus Solibacter sp.]|nr:hypothetical protein [Candidatus Solibacter sp.]